VWSSATGGRGRRQCRPGREHDALVIPAPRCGTWFTFGTIADGKGDQVDLSKLTLGEKIVAGAGIALVIDLLFLPWHTVDIGILEISRSGIESPNAFWGVVAMLLAAAMVAAVTVRRLTNAELPELGVPLEQVLFIAGVAVAALLALKLLLETDALGFGAFLGILLAAAIAYGGFLMREESGRADAGPRRTPTV
jgi:hypothetical protein